MWRGFALWNTTDVIGGPQATEMSEEYRRYRKLQKCSNIN
jgi:hypothetical protein